ncbi:MAG: hypothetical protein M3144_10875 [Actinomycetota bacterium]|nr:hypothetical protein [Actinomycetota bacterium]
MRPGTSRRASFAVVVAAALAWVGAASGDALAQTVPTTPPASSTGGPYVGYVGFSSYVGDASPYLGAGPAVPPPSPGTATAVSVDAPGDGAVLGGTADEGDAVTGWDLVGLSAMTLGAVGAIGLLMGRRRSF